MTLIISTRAPRHSSKERKRGVVMATTYKLALPLFAGIIMGAMGPEALDAQTRTPPAYLIAEIQVNNADAFKDYASQAPAIIASFGVAISSPAARRK